MLDKARQLLERQLRRGWADPTSRLPHCLARRRVRPQSKCRPMACGQSHVLTSKPADSFRADRWSFPYLFWPTNKKATYSKPYSKQSTYSMVCSLWSWVPQCPCRTDPLSWPAMEMEHELEETKWFSATGISARVWSRPTFLTTAKV